MLSGGSGPQRPQDWIKAAGTVADVVAVASVSGLSLPPLPGLAYAARDPRQPHHYEVLVAGRLRTARRIRALLRFEAAECGRPDLLHAHTPGADPALPRLARAAGTPYVLTTDGREPGGRLGAAAAAVLALPHPVDTDTLPPVPARTRISQDPVRVAVTDQDWPALAPVLGRARLRDPRLLPQVVTASTTAGPPGRGGGGRGDEDEGGGGGGTLLHDLAHADLLATTEVRGPIALTALCCGTPVVGPDPLALLRAAAALPGHRPAVLAAHARRHYGTAAAGARLAEVYAEVYAKAYAEASASGRA